MRTPVGMPPFAPGAALALALLAGGLLLHPGDGVVAAAARAVAADGPAASRAVVVPREVLDSMNQRFLEHNEHWDEASRMNRLTQLLRSGGPTQLEYMGCLQGRVHRDTVRVRGWEEARDLIQLQFGVDGDCEHVPDLVGTWHTHPYRADTDGAPVKTRDLSASDLSSFAEGRDPVILVLWDVDSLTVALRHGGRVIHPAPAVVR